VAEDGDSLRVNESIALEVVDDPADAPRPGADRAPLVRLWPLLAGREREADDAFRERVGAIRLNVAVADRRVSPSAIEDLGRNGGIGTQCATPPRRSPGGGVGPPPKVMSRMIGTLPFVLTGAWIVNAICGAFPALPMRPTTLRMTAVASRAVALVSRTCQVTLGVFAGIRP
jgi:hypothetical protein